MFESVTRCFLGPFNLNSDFALAGNFNCTIDFTEIALREFHWFCVMRSWGSGWLEAKKSFHTNILIIYYKEGLVSELMSLAFNFESLYLMKGKTRKTVLNSGFKVRALLKNAKSFINFI